MITVSGPIIVANSGADISIAKANCIAGNGLIFLIYWAGGTVDPVMAMSGETVLAAGSSAANASMTAKGWCHIFYVQSLATDGTKTFTATHANSGWAAAIIEVRGHDTGTFLDDNSGATGNGTTLSSTLTPTADNDMIVSIAAAVGGKPVADTGYTLIVVANAFDFANAQYRFNAGVLGAKTAQMTATTGQWAIKSAAFLAGPRIAAIDTMGKERIPKPAMVEPLRSGRLL